MLLYITGGFFIAWLAIRTITSFYNSTTVLSFDTIPVVDCYIIKANTNSPKNNYKKIGVMIFLMLLLSAILYFFATDTKQGWLAVVKTTSWTLSAILIWYMLIGPLFTKVIQKFLHKRQSRYSDEVLKTLSFLPVLRKLTAIVWQQSKLRRGRKRWAYFFSALIHATLTYSESQSTEVPLNKTV